MLSRLHSFTFPMNRTIIQTADGSHTIAIPDADVTYHSIHGAIGESAHVFIDAGMLQLLNNPDPPKVLRIFEMGFGTGLNAFMTMLKAEQLLQAVEFESVEAFPLEAELYESLRFTDQLNEPTLQPVFLKMHTTDWGKLANISPYFSLKKHHLPLREFSSDQLFHVIYYDAFAPNAQPDLWTVPVFEQLYGLLEPGGILTTYCSKGDVRRAMQAAGFTVEKIPGPPRKREMVRAKK